MATGQGIRPLDFVPRERCARCERPARVCVCRELVRLETQTRVIILQHPRESEVPIGTARLAELALVGAERYVGLDFDGSSEGAKAIKGAVAPPILLFPGEGAADLALSPPLQPVTLVVIDGTWWQARKLLKLNPGLASLQRYALSQVPPSRYQLRRTPSAHCVSTIEAIVHALSILEPSPNRVNDVLRPFEAMVALQLHFASEQRLSRHVKSGKPRSPKHHPVLRDRASDLVACYGEANAWPRGHELGATPELVHWAAERLSTGERFEAVVAPRLPLSPSFEFHTGISAERVRNGEPLELAQERWRAFCRSSDILVSWGQFPLGLLRRAGFQEAESIDARVAAAHFVRRKVGQVQDAAGLFAVGAVPPTVTWALGRTGARLAALLTVIQGMARACG